MKIGIKLIVWMDACWGNIEELSNAVSVNLSILESESGKLEQNVSSSTSERHSSILRTASMCRLCLALSTKVSTNTATKVIEAGIKIAMMRPTSGTSVMNNATIAPINNGTIENHGRAANHLPQCNKPLFSMTK